MVTLLAVFLVIHGLIHLLGPLKAFGWAELPQLTQPIAPAFGMLWLTASVLFLGAAMSLWMWPRVWWAVALGAVTVSTIVIVPSWTDAKAGALANVIVLAAIVFAKLTHWPALTPLTKRRTSIGH